MGLYEWIIWDYNGLYGGRCFDKVEQPHRDVTGISVRDSFPLTELFSLGNYWWFLLVVVSIGGSCKHYWINGGFPVPAMSNERILQYRETTIAISCLVWTSRSLPILPMVISGFPLNVAMIDHSGGFGEDRFWWGYVFYNIPIIYIYIYNIYIQTTTRMHTYITCAFTFTLHTCIHYITYMHTYMHAWYLYLCVTHTHTHVCMYDYIYIYRCIHIIYIYISYTYYHTYHTLQFRTPISLEDFPISMPLKGRGQAEPPSWCAAQQPERPALSWGFP